MIKFDYKRNTMLIDNNTSVGDILLISEIIKNLLKEHSSEYLDKNPKIVY